MMSFNKSFTKAWAKAVKKQPETAKTPEPVEPPKKEGRKKKGSDK